MGLLKHGEEKNDIQTVVTMDPSPKTIELPANKIQ